jgi:hypothetical protein
MGIHQTVSPSDYRDRVSEWRLNMDGSSPVMMKSDRRKFLLTSSTAIRAFSIAVSISSA